MSCDDFLPDVLAHLQKDRTDREESIVETHLNQCPPCRTQKDDYAATLRLIHELPAAPPAPDVFDRILTRIDREEAAPAPVRAPLPAQRTPRSRFWGKVAAGLVAALALALTFEQFENGARARTLARLVDVRTSSAAPPPQRVTRDGLVVPLAQGAGLERSEALVFHSGSTAVFDLPGVGSIRTDGAGTFRVVGTREMSLDAGTVYYDIEPGRGGYEITTPATRVLVTGTRFYVRATAEWTAVVVLDGSVRMGSAEDPVDVPAFHRAIARRSRPATPPEKIAALAENRLNPLATLGPDPALELRPSAGTFRSGEAAPVRLRVSSDSDDLWLEPYRDASPYYLLSIRSESDPPHTVRIARGEAAAAIARQRVDAPQNIRRNEFYDLNFDLSALIKDPGTYEITGILVSPGSADSRHPGHPPLWVGVAQSAPVVLRIESR